MILASQSSEQGCRLSDPIFPYPQGETHINIKQLPGQVERPAMYTTSCYFNAVICRIWTEWTAYHVEQTETAHGCNHWDLTASETKGGQGIKYRGDLQRLWPRLWTKGWEGWDMERERGERESPILCGELRIYFNRTRGDCGRPYQECLVSLNEGCFAMT